MPAPLAGPPLAGAPWTASDAYASEFFQEATSAQQIFPATGSIVEQYSNQATANDGTLTNPIGATDRAFYVGSRPVDGSYSGWPKLGYFRAQIEQEIVWVGARDGDFFATVTRGAENSIAVPHAAGVVVTQILTMGGLVALADPAWSLVPAGVLVNVVPGARYSGDGTSTAITFQLPSAPTDLRQVVFLVGPTLASSTPGMPAKLTAGAGDMVWDPQQQGVYSAVGGTVDVLFGQLLALKYEPNTRRWSACI